jgi:hypothetical protein
MVNYFDAIIMDDFDALISEEELFAPPSKIVDFS